jgi:hypothetical protein
MAASGEYEKVSGALSWLRANSTVLSVDEIFAVDVTEVESMIKGGRYNDALIKINKMNADMGTKGASSTMIFYLSWLRGAIFFSNQNFSSARDHLLSAETAAIAQFGKDHPRTRQVMAWRMISEIQSKPGEESHRRSMRLISNYIVDLKRQLGTDHSQVKKLDRFIKTYDRAKRVNKTEEKDLLNIL